MAYGDMTEVLDLVDEVLDVVPLLGDPGISRRCHPRSTGHQHTYPT